MPFDSDAFRKIMGRFATGVTVVTTAIDGRLHGMTANAVTSVSLDPLLLLVCVAKTAVAHGEMERASHLGVSILAADQEDVSNLFASTAEPEVDGLRGAAFRIGSSGVPLLEGAVATVECEIDERFEAGDHTIVLGRAVGGELISEAQPLLFFGGRYARIAS